MAIEKLLTLVKSKKITVGIIGLGYVGLPLTIRFSEEGFKTIGFDVDDEKVQMLNMGQSYIKHIAAENIATAIDNGFKATTEFSEIPDVDAEKILSVENAVNYINKKV